MAVRTIGVMARNCCPRIRRPGICWVERSKPTATWPRGALTLFCYALLLNRTVRYCMSHDSRFAIRQLGSGDTELVRSLLSTFGQVFEDADTYTRAQPREEYLEALLRSDHFIALAALQVGAVIGGLAAYELRKFERERSEIYIYDLAVAAQHRRKGIATALIKQLTRIAKARAAYAILVQADLT